MIEIGDIKILFAVIASILAVVAFYPYIRDLFRGETKPHAYTWLIWSLTQGTAMAGLLYGGGGFGGAAFILAFILVLFVFILSLKRGTRNITKGDTVSLIAALAAIVVWWQLDNPVLAVVMVSAIDGMGYIPTFRKSYEEPYSETTIFWLSMAVAAGLSIAALTEYNLLTVTYLATLTVANTALYLFLLYRRKKFAAIE